MRTAAHVLGAAAVARLAAAAPAPQAFEFAEIMAAPPVAFSGPPLSAISQAPTEVVSTAALLASISAQVTTVATAAITGAAAANAANISPPSTNNKKRDLEKRDLLANIMSLLGARFNQGSSTTTSAAATTSSTAAKTTSTSATGATSTPTVNIQAPAVQSTTSSSSAAAASSSTSASSASSNTGSSGTSTTSSSTACPTTPEQGTYCGFINPEDPCAPQPDGYGPNVTSPNDTPDAFMNYSPFQAMALAAVPPAGYVQTFSNFNASSSANSYMGMYTINKYDPSICSSWCDQTSGCTAFNLFIERDPSLNPCKNDSSAPTVWGYWCPNPSSITNYKCTLWGSNLDSTTAVNQGGWREDFNVVIVGSNGYDKTNITTPVLAAPSAGSSSASSSTSSVATSSASSSSAASTTSVSKAASSSSTTSTSAAASTTPTTGVKTPSGGSSTSSDPDWSSPKNCSGKAINAGNYWLGSKFINGPFDPSLCAAYAKATTAQNKQAAINAGRNTYTPCQMFNAYHLYRSGVPVGTYCALFNAQLSTSWATTTGQYSGRDYYSCRNSWTWQLNTPDSGRC